MMLKVRNRETGLTYTAIPQAVQLNPYKEKWVLRYTIVIQGYVENSFIHCIYDNDEFNATYEVLGYDKPLGEV